MEDTRKYLTYYSIPRSDAADLKIEYEYNQRYVTKYIWDFTLSRLPAKQVRAMDNLARLRWELKHKFQSDSSYSSWQIPKRSGGFRTIESPNEGLKETQRKIVDCIVNDLKWLPHNCAHGFVKGRNCKTALEVHKKNKSRWFLKMDISDFFGSTTAAAVEKAIEKQALLQRVSTIAQYLVNEHGVLPQGAPTSPLMCNIVMMEYDIKISEYCKKNKLIYTRYADDILISSRVDWDKDATIEFIRNTLNPHYKLSEHKTRYGSFNGRNWNLGMMYTHNSNGEIILSAGYERKKHMKSAVYNLEKAKAENKELDYCSEKAKLIGEIGYIIYIEPENETMKRLLERVKAI